MGVHRDSNSQRGSSLVSVKAYSLTLSCILESMRHDSRASFLARNFATLCFGREPKAKVTTPLLQVFFPKLIESTLLSQNSRITQTHHNLYCHSDLSEIPRCFIISLNVTLRYYYYFYFLSHEMYGATKKRIPKSKLLAKVGHSSHTSALIFHNSNLWSPRPRWHTQLTQKKEKLNFVFYFHCI